MSDESKMSDDMQQQQQLSVNDDCYAGLRTLRNLTLLASAPDCDDKLCSSWTTAVAFNADGCVTLLDLGGKRLYKGFPGGAPPIQIIFKQQLGAHLTTLNVAGTDLPLKDTMAILELVAPTIQALYVGGNGLGVAGAKALGRWSPSASQLIKLDVRYNDIGCEGMEALCEGLGQQQSCSKVQYLYAEGNQIGDQGAIALSQLLLLKTTDADGSTVVSSSSLREIFLGANQIQSQGAAALASSLHSNKTVSKIYLEGNQIGLQGANAFSTVLEELDGNTALKNLFVDNNNIGKEGSKRLASALNSATAMGDGLGD
jgi:hypothetical protein